MTLTAGDMAILVGMMATVAGTAATAARYFVKSEIKIACNELRMEWAKDRASVLEQRIDKNSQEN